MLFESANVRVAFEFGTATLWLGFRGSPVNALDAAGLRELDAALAAIEQNIFANIVVIRSGKPAGFCAGIHPEALASLATAADRAAFSWLGQSVFARLGSLRATTVAYLDGPCLGAGLELALACDYRLCCTTIATHLGFPDRVPTGFGGGPRLCELLGRRLARTVLDSGRTFSGREARKLGFVDRAFCERRAKIELRTFLDELECGAASPRCGRELAGLADERRAFAQNHFRLRDTVEHREAIHVESPSGIARALARGFLTPLEAEQARSIIENGIGEREASGTIPALELVAA